MSGVDANGAPSDKVTKIEGVRRRTPIKPSPMASPMNSPTQPTDSTLVANSFGSPTLLASPQSPTNTSSIYNQLSLVEETKFQATIDFVRAYLDNVVQQATPFGDKEQNKLTFEVFILTRPLSHYRIIS